MHGSQCLLAPAHKAAHSPRNLPHSSGCSPYPDVQRYGHYLDARAVMLRGRVKTAVLIIARRSEMTKAGQHA